MRLYGMLPFALSKGLTWVPFVAIRTLLFSVMYWLAHLQFRADKYFLFLAAVFLMNSTASRCGRGCCWCTGAGAACVPPCALLRRAAACK